MTSRVEGYYFVIRYMYNELREEAANVGLVLVQPEPFAVHTRFIEDPRLKARVDVGIDKAIMESFSRWLDAAVASTTERVEDPAKWVDSFTERLREHTGNIIRFIGPRFVAMESIDAEFEVLFKDWISPRGKRVRLSEPPARDPLGGLRKAASRAITQAVRQELERPLRSTKVFRRDYEVRGERTTSRFDLALISRKRTKTQELLFHHVLMLPDAEESFNQAAALSWRWEDVCERNGKNRQLTAVLYSRANTKVQGVREARSLLKAEDIEVATLDQLPSIAKRVSVQPQFAFA